SLPIEAVARRIILKVPIRLTRITRSKSASGWGPSRPATRLATPMPAQLTSTRAGPGFVRDVADDAEAAGGSRRLGRRGGIEVEDRDPRAPGGKRLCGRAAQSRAAAGHDRRNAGELHRPSSLGSSEPKPARLAARRFAPRSAELQEQPAPFDLHRISRKIHTGRRALRFAGGEVEPAVMHRTFDDRALDIAVGESRLFVGANAVGGEVAAIRRSIERILPAFVLERRDVLGRYAVGGSSVDPAFA